MTNNANSKKNTVICIFLALVIIFTLAIPVFGAEAFLSIEKGAGDSMSDTFLEAKQVKLNGRIYKSSGHGAYFYIMKENPGENKYIEEVWEFHNYTDTGSKSDEEGKYLPLIFESSTTANNIARKTRINPYRVYNDVRAKAKLTKLS